MTLSFELSGQLKSLPSVYNTTRPTGEKTGPLQVKERSREARRHRIGMPKTRHGFLRRLFAVWRRRANRLIYLDPCTPLTDNVGDFTLATQYDLKGEGMSSFQGQNRDPL